MASILQHLRQHLSTRCLLCTLPLHEAGLGQAYMSTLCAVCATIHKDVRRRCQRCKVAFLGDITPQAESCACCELSMTALCDLAVALDYMAPTDSLVWRFKSQLQLRLAPYLAQLMVAAIQAESWSLPASTWVVAIPSSRQAVIRRGFNPAAELARYVASMLGLVWKPAALSLNQPAGALAQKQRSQDQRWSYAQQAFRWCAHSTPTTVLVVDDVVTTGSTMHGAAVCAQSQGVQQVYGVALARTPWRHT